MEIFNRGCKNCGIVFKCNGCRLIESLHIEQCYCPSCFAIGISKNLRTGKWDPSHHYSHQQWYDLAVQCWKGIEDEEIKFKKTLLRYELSKPFKKPPVELDFL